MKGSGAHPNKETPLPVPRPLKETDSVNILSYAIDSCKEPESKRKGIYSMETGYRTFAENFRRCCGESMERLAYEQGKADPGHLRDCKRRDALFEQLCGLLGDDSPLANQYDAAMCAVFSFDDAYVYQQGFRDCVYLLRWMGAL